MLFADGERSGTGNCSDVTFGDTAIKSLTSVVSNGHSKDQGYQGSSFNSPACCWLCVGSSREMIVHLSARKRCPDPPGRAQMKVVFLQ